jgi:D-alanine-D-alanine ligase-like ATP-grasp enzyme
VTGAAASPHVVLLAGVGGLSPASAMPAIGTVSKRLSVVFVDAWTTPDAVRGRWEDGGFTGEFLVAGDLDRAVGRALELHERNPVHGVVTYSELLLRPQADIAEKLGLPGNSPDSVRAAQSKARQREIFAAAGVPSPRYAVIGGADGLAAAAAAIGFPAVVKPSLGAGSQGVRPVGDLEELIGAYTKLTAENTPFIQEDTSVVLEEQLDLMGRDDSPYAGYCSVESLIHDGEITHIAICDRLRLRHGYIEEGLVLPTRLDDDVQHRLENLAAQAIQALGLRSGATHTEIAFGDGELRVIEVNARAGGPVVGMMAAAGDYDFAADIARVALGVAPPGRPRFPGVAWFRFLPVPEGDWRVVKQRPVPALRERFDDLVYLRPRFEPGSVVSRAMTQHLASFLVRGRTVAAAMATAEDVEREFGIELEPVQ